MKLEYNDNDEGVKASLLRAPANEFPPSYEEKGGATMKRQSGADVKKFSIRRTTLVAALVSLIVGAITSTAFAVMSPRISSPVVALTAPLDNGPPSIPKKYIEDVLAHVWHNGPPPSNSTRPLLEKRLDGTNKCEIGQTWLRRICSLDISPDAWNDVCQRPGGLHYTDSGWCPPFHFCSEHILQSGTSVKCLPHPMERLPDSKDNSYEYDSTNEVSQYGYRRINAWQQNSHSFQESIEVMWPMVRGTVYGFLVDKETGGTGTNIPITPTNVLIAHRRGFRNALCKGGLEGQDCTPLTTTRLNANDKIDFTWTNPPDQEVVLFYSYWGYRK